MIHTRVSRNPENKISEIHISVTEDSLQSFEKLIYRGLNCWDTAPAELKELGDMLTHGRVTQDHSFKPMNTKQTGGDYYSPKEREIIQAYILKHGNDAWFKRIREGTTGAVLDLSAED